MSSLKSHTAELAKLLETTTGALYERQRVLVRAGLLHQTEGRGPGSGVHATPSAGALVLIAAMATDNLSDVAIRVRQIANSKVANGSCGLTGKRTFHAALASILASEALASRVAEIRISRSLASARILYSKIAGMPIRVFTDFSTNASASANYGVTLVIDGRIVRELAETLGRDWSRPIDSFVAKKERVERGKT